MWCRMLDDEFDRFDLNNDGVLDRDEVTQLAPPATLCTEILLQGSLLSPPLATVPSHENGARTEQVFTVLREAIESKHQEHHP